VREMITLRKQKLNFTFHNPNSEKETVKYITKLLAEVAVSKVIKATGNRVEQAKINESAS